MRSFVAAVFVIGAAASMSGCDAAKSAVARAGLAGFEARCETSLPPTRIDVVAAPVVYDIDRSRSWRELTLMSGDAGSELLALGLTTAQVGHQATMETMGIESQNDGRVCMRPSIRVELSATPMKVYISEEIAGDPCREAVALEHELRHVAVYEDEMANIANEVRARLRATYGNQVLYYPSRSQAQRDLKETIGTEIGPILADDAHRIKERQRAIDTPEEYARVAVACGGMLKSGS
jgi:hypothetical protein